MKKTKFLAALAAIILALPACGNSNHPATDAAPTDTVVQNDSLTPSTPKSDTLTLAMVGDIMMGTTYPDSVHGSALPADRGRRLFDDAAPILRRVDIACGNMESSFLDGPGRRRPMGRNPKTYFVFRTPTDFVNNLTDTGIDFMGMANNHVNDFGGPGRRSTIKTLNEAGIANAGLKGKTEIAVIERGGHRVAFTQFSHGANTLDINNLSELRRVIKQMRDTADIVIVAFHGGAEGTAHLHVPHKAETYVGENRGNVEAFAHAAIDAGAALVYGHGPHVPRAAELYKGHLILYSLGNFCTPYRMGIAGATGLAPIAEAAIDASTGRFLEGKIHSLRQHRGIGPRLDKTNEAARLIRDLSSKDFPGSGLVIADDGTLSVGPEKK